MSSTIGGFLFGNIDEEGKLDNEDFDEELRANLTTFSERIQDKKILLDDLVSEDLMHELDPNKAPEVKLQKSSVVPLPEAENFEDITELADATSSEIVPQKRKIVAEALVEPLSMRSVNNTLASTATETADSPQFDTRQILKFTRLSAKPALLNATGRSYSRYASLRRLRFKKKHHHHGKLSLLSENQLDVFLTKTGPSLPTPSTAAARLRLSLINLNATTSASAASTLTSTMKMKQQQQQPWLHSARFQQLQCELLKAKLCEEDSTISTSLNHTVKVPDISHFHPLALTAWEDSIIWDDAYQVIDNVNQSHGMFVNMAPTSGHNTSASASTNSSSNINKTASNSSPATSPSGASLSSILSSLSLSNGALGGGDSATATALLALIRNQQLRSASLSAGSINSSMSLSRPPSHPISRTTSISSIPPASVKLKYPKSAAARIRNQFLDSGEWTDSIIWSIQTVNPAILNTHLYLPLDDPELIFTPQPIENLSKKLGRAEKLIAKRIKKLNTPSQHGNGTSANLLLTSFSRPIADKFNLSNDKYYESGGNTDSTSSRSGGAGKMATNSSGASNPHSLDAGSASQKPSGVSMRSSVSPAFLGLRHSVPALQHSIPALKLSPPAFQTCRTKRELRLWHRARLAPPPQGFKIDSWLRVRIPTSGNSVNGKKSNTSAPSSHLKTIDTEGNNKTLKLTITCNPSGGIIRSSKKLTLKDSSRFAILEYSEEFPPLLMNPGMGAYIVLYYRKRSPQDTFVPRSTFALVQILDFTDSSPFWMFGDVPAGTCRYALCNGLFRAPLFLHRSAPSDFIICRHQQQQPQQSTNPTPSPPEFYLRPLETAPVFLVGQEFPLVEVPGPHSRRHNLFCRQRLQVAAYRLFNKDITALPETSARKRLKIGRLLTAFPQFSEGSIRKWLKDYSESTRTGKDSGVWLQKLDAPQLEEDELRVLVSPEAICQYESMMAEQQRLTDAEIILHNPTLAKGQEIDLQDDSMALDDDSQAAHPQKKLRSQELENLSAAAPWNTTANFLGAVNGRSTLKLRGIGDPTGRGEAFSLVKAPGEKGTSNAVANAAGSEYRQDINRIWEAHVASLEAKASPISVIGESSANDNLPAIEDSKDAVSMGRLVLSRRFGVDQWIKEEITDPLVIKAYLRVRQQTVADSIAEKKGRRGFVAPDALPQLSPADALPLSIPKRSASTKKKSSYHKKPSQSQTSNGPTSEKSLQIRCGACGQVGHMRTNRICPLHSDHSNSTGGGSGDGGSGTANVTNQQQQQNQSLKVRLKLSSNASSSVGSNLLVASKSATAPSSSVSSNESIYPSPVLVPVNVRPKGPPIEPIIRKKNRKLTPKQLHAQFLASQSPQVRAKLAALSTIFTAIIDSLLLLPTTPAFHKPVPKKLYPLYYKLISNPIDLSTIRSKAVALTYTSISAFSKDFALLLENCQTFNGKDSPLASVARDIFDKVQTDLEASQEVKEIDAFLLEHLISESGTGPETITTNYSDIEVSIMTDQEEEEEEDRDGESKEHEELEATDNAQEPSLEVVQEDETLVHENSALDDNPMEH